LVVQKNVCGVSEYHFWIFPLAIDVVSSGKGCTLQIIHFLKNHIPSGGSLLRHQRQG
jgi:hypothetical protein